MTPIIKRLLLPASALLSIFLMLVSLGNAGGRDLASFINADSMFFHAMYNDLLQGNCFLGWDLNTTFNLMPNAFLYAVALLISNHPVTSQIIHGVLQYSLLLWGAWYMLGSIIPRPNTAVIATVLLLPAWFFISAMHTGDYFFSAQFYHPYHVGALIMTCILLGLNLRELYHDKAAHRLPWIIILGALAAFSNRIFIVMFLLPWLLSLIFLWIQNIQTRRTVIQNAVMNIAGVAAGMFLFSAVGESKNFSFHSTHMFSWDNVLPSLQIMTSTYRHYLLSGPVMALIMLLSLGVFIFIVMKLYRSILFKGRAEAPTSDGPVAGMHFLLFTLIFVPGLFLSPVLLGMFFDSTAARYNFMVMPWLLLCLAPLMNRLWQGKPWQIVPHTSIFVVLWLITLVAGLWFIRSKPPVEGIREIVNMYPAKARCIDNAAETYNLKNGIAEFWDAKPVTAFSRKGIKVRQIYNDSMYPYFLGVNRNWYFPFCSNTPVPVFNFIIHSDALDPAHIHMKFGNNIDTLVLEHCTLYLVPDFTYQKVWREGIIFLDEETTEVDIPRK